MPRLAGLDMGYVLWLGAMAAGILASVSILLTIVLFLANQLGEMIWNSPLFPSVNYWGIGKVILLFTGMSGVAQLLRLRLIHLANSIVQVPFPEEIAAHPQTGDPALDKFECVGRMTINVYDPSLADVILAGREKLKEVLQDALSLAVSDPVTRYSKEKIEHTLRMALAQVLPLDRIAGVTLLNLRHRRTR